MTTPRPEVLSLVLPAHGEAENLRQLLPGLLELDSLGGEIEIVVVDDHSPDDTFRVVSDWAARDARVKGLRLARNSGSHLAILCGLEVARGAAVVVLAADGQDPPSVVADLVDAWREGGQVVWAVRQGREGESVPTRIFSRAYWWLMNRTTDLRLPPAGADLCLLDRRVVDAIKAIPEHRVSFFALVASLGFRQSEVSYVKQARRAGRSKWTLGRKLGLVVDSLVGFSMWPLRLATILGFLHAFCGFVYATLLMVNKLTGGSIFGAVPVTGFAALMTVLLVSSGTIMLILGIFGEYLWRTLVQVRGRPRYLIEDSTASDHAPR